MSAKNATRIAGAADGQVFSETMLGPNARAVGNPAFNTINGQMMSRSPDEGEQRPNKRVLMQSDIVASHLDSCQKKQNATIDHHSSQDTRTQLTAFSSPLQRPITGAQASSTVTAAGLLASDSSLPMNSNAAAPVGGFLGGVRPMTAGNEHGSGAASGGLVSRNGNGETIVKRAGFGRPKSIHNIIGPSGIASMYNLR